MTGNLITNNPVDELMVVGHSLGTVDSLYMTPVLENLLTQTGNTKIGGQVLFSALGHRERSLIKLLTYDIPTVKSLVHEINEVFSTNEAMERLPDNVRKRVLTINAELTQTTNSAKRLELNLRKYMFLRRVMVNILRGADNRKPAGFPKDKINLLYIILAHLYQRKNNVLVDQLPEWVRDKNHFPTAIVLGKKDPYTYLALSVLQAETPFYKNVPILETETKKGGSHAGIRAIPEEYARIGLGAYNRLKKREYEMTHR